MLQFSYLYMTTGKTIALTRPTFVGKVMSLLLNMLSRFVIAFFPRSKYLLISWLQSPSTVILEPKTIKFWHCVPIYLPWSDGTRCHDLIFLNVVLSQLYHSPPSPSSRGSSVPLHFLPLEYHLHIWGCWYFFRQSWFLACDSPSPAFHMMYFAWKLNKLYIQPWCTSFLILNQSISGSNYCFLCCIQVSQEAGKVIWYSHLSEFSMFGKSVCCDPHSQRL